MILKEGKIEPGKRKKARGFVSKEEEERGRGKWGWDRRSGVEWACLTLW
jgi:hypothetical protein